jgi:hypothetical protein
VRATIGPKRHQASRSAPGTPRRKASTRAVSPSSPMVAASRGMTRAPDTKSSRG